MENNAALMMLTLRCHIGPSHVPSRPEVAVGIACDAAVSNQAGVSSILILLTTLRSSLPTRPTVADYNPLEIYLMVWRAAQQFVPQPLLDELGGEEGFLHETAGVAAPVLKALADSRIPLRYLETACFFIARAVAWQRFPCFADVHEAGLELEARGMDLRRTREANLRNVFQFQTGHADAPNFGYLPSSLDLAYAFVGINRDLSLFEPLPLQPKAGWLKKVWIEVREFIHPTMEFIPSPYERAHPIMET